MWRAKMEQERKRADDIVKKLIDTHTTISTMESCTSGLIASMITDTEGASAIFPGGYVTYLNETKILNGVDANVIEKYGVYSNHPCVIMYSTGNEVAETAQKKLHTDIAIGITGTTGNVDPNNADSVQGQVYFCIRMGKENHTYELETVVSEMNRHEIKQMYADYVFEKLELLLKKE